jgi:hypothetical protein
MELVYTVGLYVVLACNEALNLIIGFLLLPNTFPVNRVVLRTLGLESLIQR